MTHVASSSTNPGNEMQPAADQSMVPADGTADVERRLSQIDMSGDKLDIGRQQFLNTQVKTSESGMILAAEGIAEHKNRADARKQAGQITATACLQVYNDARSRNEDGYLTAAAAYSGIDIGGPREAVENQIRGVKEIATNLREASERSANNEIVLIRDGGKTMHIQQMALIKQYAADVQGFMATLRDIQQLERDSLKTLAEDWLETRTNQLTVMKEAISEVIAYRKELRAGVIENRKDLRAGVREEHELSEETGKRVHGELTNLEELSQKRERQKRADDLSDKRLQLQKDIEEFKHKVKMREIDANDKPFWDRLLKPFYCWF